MNISTFGNFKTEIQKLTQIITPTLVIGLGGSGKRVILYLRKMFFEKYSLPTIPIVDYLYFDTDTGDLTGDPNNIDLAVQLTKKDIIDATISKDVFDSIINNFEGKYPHISAWMIKDAIIPKIQASGIQDGSKQIRPIGKLTFFNKYDEFVKKIKIKVRGITDFNSIRETEEIFYRRNKIRPDINNQRIELIVVGSLAGGTGAGTFIDAGFAANYWANNVSGNSSINSTGLFFLPSTFANNSNIDMNKANANGYAALKELNYYLSPYRYSKSKEYNLKFEWERGQVVEISNPVYDVAYLLENSTRDGHSLGSDNAADDVFSMAAEFLFLDFDESNFSTKKRSLHSNDNAELGNITKNEYANCGYIETFANRFSSFGLSQIKMNLDKVRNAAKYKFAGDMLSTIIRRRDLRTSWFDDINGWKELNLDQRYIAEEISYEITANIRGSLENGSGNYPGMNAIRKEISDYELPGKIEDISRDLDVFIRKINSLIEFMISHISKQFLDGDVRAVGAVTAQLADRTREFFEKASKSARVRLYDYLINFESEGITYAEEFIAKLKNHLIRLKDDFSELRQTNTLKPCLIESKGIGYFTKEYDDVIKKFAEAKSLFMLPPLFRNSAVNFYRRELRKSEDAFYSKIKNNLYELLMTKEKEIQGYIDNIVREKIADKVIIQIDKMLSDVVEIEAIRISNYRETLDYFIKEMHDWFKDFTSAKSEGRNLELTLNWEDQVYEEEIKKNLGSENYYALLVEKIREFFRNDNNYKVPNNDLDDKYIYIQDVLERTRRYRLNIKDSWNELYYEKFIPFIENLFMNFKISGDIDNVVDHFENSYSNPTDMQNAINNVLKFASPRVRVNPNIGFVKNIREIALLGVDADKKSFLNVIKQTGQDFTPQEFTRDSIIFYKEMIAFPLGIIGEIDNMKNSYDILEKEDHHNKYLRFLEKDMDKYPDILFCRTNKEAEDKISRLKPFLLSLTVGEMIQDGIVYDPRERSFFLLKESKLGKTKIRLRSDFNRSFFELAEKEKNEINKEVNLLGGRLINRWLNKEGDKGIEKLFRLYIVLADLAKGLSKNDARCKTAMLPNTLLALAEEMQCMLLKEVYKIDEHKLERYKKEQITAKDFKNENPDFFIKEKELGEEIELFSREIDYFEESIGRRLRILR